MAESKKITVKRIQDGNCTVHAIEQEITTIESKKFRTILTDPVLPLSNDLHPDFTAGTLRWGFIGKDNVAQVQYAEQKFAEKAKELGYEVIFE